MNQDDNKKTKIAAGLGFMSVNRIDALVKNSSSIRRMTLPILANNLVAEKDVDVKTFSEKYLGEKAEEIYNKSVTNGDFVKQMRED